MDKDTFVKFAPVIVVIVTFLFQYNFFVTPAQLEQTHREILLEVAKTYTRKETSDNFQKQFEDIQRKIDKIYDKLIINK